MSFPIDGKTWSSVNPPITGSTANATEAVTPGTDTLTPAARNALWASALGYALDGFDLLILGFMLRAISADLGLDPAKAAFLVTATLLGAVIGGLLFGLLSDRFGRVRVLTWTILLFAVATGLCAVAQSNWDLLVYRTLAGLGLGGRVRYWNGRLLDCHVSIYPRSC